jgi:hypothetical protein
MIYQNMSWRILELFMNNTNIYKYYLNKRNKVQQYLLKYANRISNQNGLSLLFLLLRNQPVSIVR